MTENGEGVTAHPSGLESDAAVGTGGHGDRGRGRTAGATVSGVRPRPAAFFERSFVPGEVFRRAGDRLRGFRPTTRAQKRVAAGLALVLGWVSWKVPIKLVGR